MPKLHIICLKRYNPYKEYNDKQSDTEHDYDHFYNQEFSDKISYISQADTILKNLKNYFSKSLASVASDVKADFSTLFYSTGVALYVHKSFNAFENITKHGINFFNHQ